jgi:plastocyanin
MRAVAATVAALALGLAVVPALAADDKTLEARDYVFDQPDVTIDVGNTVTFGIAPGSAAHSFAFSDGPSYPPSPEPPGPAWDNQSRTFNAAGTYTYACGLHPSMTGVIRVQSPGATPTATASATPDPSGEPIEVRTLRVTAATFCTKRGPKCRKPGVKVRIDLSQPAAVTGTLKRRTKGYGRVDFGTVAAGPRTLRFTRNAAGRRLKAGRYKLRLTIAGRPPQTLSFKVR